MRTRSSVTSLWLHNIYTSERRWLFLLFAQLCTGVFYDICDFDFGLYGTGYLLVQSLYAWYGLLLIAGRKEEITSCMLSTSVEWDIASQMVDTLGHAYALVAVPRLLQ